MKGMIFLDENFKVVKLPKVDSWFNWATGDLVKSECPGWKEFAEKIRYAYFTMPERMRWFRYMYKQFDDMNSLFAKEHCRLYSYDVEDDYWHTETDEEVQQKVSEIYWANVLGNKEEVND